MYVLQTLCGVSNVSRSLGCSRPYRVSCNHITTCLCVYTRPWANPLKLRSTQQGSSACTTLCVLNMYKLSNLRRHSTLQRAICHWYDSANNNIRAIISETEIAWRTRSYDSEGEVCMLVKVSIGTVVCARVAVGWTLAHRCLSAPAHVSPQTHREHRTRLLHFVFLNCCDALWLEDSKMDLQTITRWIKLKEWSKLDVAKKQGEKDTGHPS